MAAVSSRSTASGDTSVETSKLRTLVRRSMAFQKSMLGFLSTIEGGAAQEILRCSA
jgi:hypothetical protein